MFKSYADRGDQFRALVHALPNNIMKLPSFSQRKETPRHDRAPLARGAGGMDYEEMSEPNMKLSRALLIVLVLHVVAVAGIIAFNTIKTRESMTSIASQAGEAGHGRRLICAKNWALAVRRLPARLLYGRVTDRRKGNNFKAQFLRRRNVANLRSVLCGPTAL